MKFGKTLLAHQIPEWHTYYINYKQLKHVCKLLDESPASALAAFFYDLDREIEKVSAFYLLKFDEYLRRLVRVIAVVQELLHLDDLDEVVAMLLELRSSLRSLKWYGDLNHKGFIKILKKLDKKVAAVNARPRSDDPAFLAEVADLPVNNQQAYLDARVNALAFANAEDVVACLNSIHVALSKLDNYTGPNSDFVPLPSRNSPDSTENVISSIIQGDDGQAMLRFLKGLAPPVAQSSVDGFAASGDSPFEPNLIAKKHTPDKQLLSLLNKAALAGSLKCVSAILEFGVPFCDTSDISGRTFFHQHIIGLGKRYEQSPQHQQRATPGELTEIDRFLGSTRGQDGGSMPSPVCDGLKQILTHLPTLDLQVLMARDNYQRTALHYAAQYGLKDVTKLLLEYIDRGKLRDHSISIDSVKDWGDRENLTPLHLAIIGDHPKTTACLIQSNESVPLTSDSLLLLAVRLNLCLILLSLIMEGKIDIDYTDEEHNHETALYIAAKLQYDNLVEFLLENGANPEIGEKVFGWTPIFVAACEGFAHIVRILIQAGCIFDMVDDLGWLPMEHACLRGHPRVADMLRPADPAMLLYDAAHPERNVPRVPLPSTPVELAKSASTEKRTQVAGADLAHAHILAPTSSVDRLPEHLTFSRVNSPPPYALSASLPPRDLPSLHGVYKHLKTSASPAPGSHHQESHRSMDPTLTSYADNHITPIKSFGHRYLGAGESLIMITLGTTDLRDLSPPIDLNKISLSAMFETELDTALSLSITCRHIVTNVAVEPPVIIDLPLEDHHGSATDPVTFKLVNDMSADEVVLAFDLIPTYQYSSTKHHLQKRVLGRAVALLKDAYTPVGPHLRSLNDNITLPIMELSTLKVLGSLRFQYVCVQLFGHQSMSFLLSDMYWKKLVSTRVIGHRGLGKNVSGRNSLQLGENTVESFIAAASLGASYVEFDVQLTKDFVPVIYHDFTVAELGVDIPMHALTAEQFLSLNAGKSSTNQHRLTKSRRGSDNVTPLVSQYGVDDALSGNMRRRGLFLAFPSAPNFCAPTHGPHMNGGGETDDVEEEGPRNNHNADDSDHELHNQVARRMKLTKTWKDKGYKGNARGLSVALNFVTLKELFKKVPSHVGFNVEIKYPMLDQAEQESMGEIAIDLNFYVDTILKVIFDENVSDRQILFSSFHPDICMLLSLKQPSIPILFLTELGLEPMADIRASSLQNAIRFAKKWNLLGIVSAAETLVKCPRLTQVVKSSGLVCVTYGVSNNDPELAKIQMKAGVDAVIADKVLAVREGLRRESAQGQEETTLLV